MKVLIVNTYYYPHEIGGAEKSVRLLAEGLVSRGYEVAVLVLSDNDTKEKDLVNGVIVYRVPIRNVYNPSKVNGGLVKASKFKKILWHITDYYNIFSLLYLSKEFDTNFDIIHTNNISGFSVSIWDWAKKRNKLIVHTSRDYYLFHPNCTMYNNGANTHPKSLKIRCLSYFKKIKSKKVDVYIGISSFIHDLHIKNGFFAKAMKKEVIYNSIGRTLNEHGLENNHKFSDGRTIKLGYIGRLDQAKGIEVIIDYLKSSNLNFSLQIAGKGKLNYVQKLKEKCKDDERFSFLGQVNIDSYFNLIDCLICPSIWNEPMGRVVIESYSYGVPVIANTAGGISELVESGRTGFLFNIKSKESFIAALDLYKSVDHSLLSLACIDAAKKFSDEAYVDSYLAIYNELHSSGKITK